jgi:hypothetical protein
MCADGAAFGTFTRTLLDPETKMDDQFGRPRAPQARQHGNLRRDGVVPPLLFNVEAIASIALSTWSF